RARRHPERAARVRMVRQRRDAKAARAGKAESWRLAGDMLKERRQRVAVVSKAVPRFKGLPVPDLGDAAVSQPITLLDYAIKLGYQRQFDEAYESLTKGCNACHATTDHASVVIKTPAASPCHYQASAPERRPS